MKAVLCRTLDGPGALVVEELPAPEPAPDQVVIQVSAAALNFFDTLMVRGRYQFKPELPFSPGGEIAGRIDRIGAGVAGLAVGQRVMAHVRHGGCREQIAVAGRDVIPVPDGVSDEAAAAVTVTYGTAIHALKDRGRLTPGATLAVLGAAGGAGLAAVEIGKLMGARVIAVASSAEKLAVCRAHGADALLNYAEQDLKDGLKMLTDGRGVDVIYDCVGGPHAEPALRATAWEGRYLVVGFAAGDIPRMPLNLLLLKGCDMAGVFFGQFVARHPERHRANMAQVLVWCAEGRLRPHIHGSYPLEQTAQALTLIAERRVTGKVLIRP